MMHLTFTQLLPEIEATYREQNRAFHVLATRYYLGAETRETLELQARHVHNYSHPMLTQKQVDEIVMNR